MSILLRTRSVKAEANRPVPDHGVGGDIGASVRGEALVECRRLGRPKRRQCARPNHRRLRRKSDRQG
jgi:hypothetical protein